MGAGHIMRRSNYQQCQKSGRIGSKTTQKWRSTPFPCLCLCEAVPINLYAVGKSVEALPESKTSLSGINYPIPDLGGGAGQMAPMAPDGWWVYKLACLTGLLIHTISDI